MEERRQVVFEEKNLNKLERRGERGRLVTTETAEKKKRKKARVKTCEKKRKLTEKIDQSKRGVTLRMRPGVLLKRNKTRG